MKEVVSVSLGSSRRDHEATAEFLGEKFRIRRVGVDGDLKRMIEVFKELDGKVDAFGLGGISLHLWAPGGKRYAIRDAKKIQKVISKTPLADGGGLKDTLEREVVKGVADNADIGLRGKTVLMVSAVDRYGMAEALHEVGCPIIFGDLIFGLNIPIAIRSMGVFKVLAYTLLPIVTKLPFQILYPTGEKQEKESVDKRSKYYREADVIAGDYLLIRKYMPDDMTGKIVLTNTVTAADVADMKKRGVKALITTTPELQGRSFGTNVMEATLLAAMNKRAEDISPQDYLDMLHKLDFKPRIERLN